MAEYSRPKTEQDLKENFGQINPNMTATMATLESSRCLFCHDAPCIQACPTSIDIPLFIRQINTGNINGAAKTIYDANYFANVCGKACPTEVLCEGACVYNHQDIKPIEIGRLQSYASTHAIQSGKLLYKPLSGNGKSIAVIGAGPAGISCACELSRWGYKVDIYEAKPNPSGLIIHGVAPYKLTNKEVMDEVNYLQKQFGFQIIYNTIIASEQDIGDLESKYQAIVLGIGLGETRSMGIPGENLGNCVGATEFIERIKLDPFNTFVGSHVIVVGGGNTAMDAASEAARMGAEKVVLAYRRPKDSKPAYDFEYDLAKSVGVKGIFSVTPTTILGKKLVEGVRFLKTEVKNGTVMPIEGSEFEMHCDMVIKATGQSKMKDFLGKISGLELNKDGTIKVEPGSHQTSNPKYFASGDAVNGGMEVVNAVAEAKLAAKGVHEFLQK